MMFQKPNSKQLADVEILAPIQSVVASEDNVETIVGPSVNVEGDFASEGNIIVKGSVAGSVHTSRHLAVEFGAKIMANVRAGSAQVAGEVRGNMKVKESLELLSTARVTGDIEAKTLVIEAGALLFGKVMMPGLEESKPKSTRGGFGKKSEEIAAVV
ncbi:MAG: polymer-forming cytoskeletal protein [Candidatus Magasanikbacteria bacterium]